MRRSSSTWPRTSTNFGTPCDSSTCRLRTSYMQTGHGNIGYQAPGKIPIREGWDGRVPVPGWSHEYEWSGFVPFDDLPFHYNPEEGYIVTANNPVVDDSYPFLITTDWNYGDRAARIVAMIEADPSIDVADVAAMQRDTLNPHAARLVPWIVDVDLAGEDEIYRQARQILLDWNQANEVDSAGAAVFEAVWSNLLRLTFHDDLSEDLWPAGGSRWSIGRRRDAPLSESPVLGRSDDNSRRDR